MKDGAKLELYESSRLRYIDDPGKKNFEMADLIADEIIKYGNVFLNTYHLFKFIKYYSYKSLERIGVYEDKLKRNKEYKIYEDIVKKFIKGTNKIPDDRWLSGKDTIYEDILSYILVMASYFLNLDVINEILRIIEENDLDIINKKANGDDIEYKGTMFTGHWSCTALEAACHLKGSNSRKSPDLLIKVIKRLKEAGAKSDYYEEIDSIKSKIRDEEAQSRIIKALYEKVPPKKKRKKCEKSWKRDYNPKDSRR